MREQGSSVREPLCRMNRCRPRAWCRAGHRAGHTSAWEACPGEVLASAHTGHTSSPLGCYDSPAVQCIWTLAPRTAPPHPFSDSSSRPRSSPLLLWLRAQLPGVLHSPLRTANTVPLWSGQQLLSTTGRGDPSQGAHLSGMHPAGGGEAAPPEQPRTRGGRVLPYVSHFPHPPAGN